MTGRANHRVAREGGFTMIEMMIVATVFIPLLMGILDTSRVVNRTVETNSRAAAITAQLRSTVRRIADFARAGKLSTITVQAVSADVVASRASAVGEWIAPTDLIWRPGLQFQAASGLLSMNAALSTSPRVLTYRMEPGEIDNDVDDDGDGLIDEGSIRLVHDSSTIAMIHGVEDCAFCLDGRMLGVRARIGRQDSEGRVFRGFQEQWFYLRNN